MQKYANLICAVGLLIVAVGGTADAARPRFRVSPSTARIQGAGLQMRLPAGASATPLQPPEIRTYRDSRTGTLTERISARAFWYSRQHLGRWIDQYGGVMTIAEVKYPLPNAMIGKYMTTAELRGAFIERDAGSWKKGDIEAWAASYASSKSTKAATKLNLTFKIQEAIEFHFPGNLFAFAFRMKKAAGAKEEPSWYFAMFRLHEELDGRAARKKIVDTLLKSIVPAKATAARDGAHSRRYQNRDGLDRSKRSSEFVASRDRVVSSIQNMRGWWFVETENYIIVSDLNQRDRKLFKRLQTDIEYVRAAYGQFLPARQEVDAISVLRVFAEQEDYKKYVGPQVAWSAGAWISSRQELVIRPRTGARGKQNMARVLSVMYHEAFHQYVFYAYRGRAPSVWFNEGHAEFFEVAVIDDRKLSVPENEAHVAIVETLARAGELRVNSILWMDYKQFYRNEDRGDTIRANHYAMAWGLVYYLRKAVPLDKDSPYRDVLKKYGDALWETRSGEAASRAAFKGIGMKQFERDYTRFWRSRHERQKAERNRIFKAYGGRSGK